MPQEFNDDNSSQPLLRHFLDRFKDYEVHIIGSGPSLIGFDYSTLKNKRVITVNHSYKLIKSEFTVFIDKEFKKDLGNGGQVAILEIGDMPAVHARKTLDVKDNEFTVFDLASQRQL